MIGNIENCIGFLERFGVNVNGINAKDIYEGNLKSILTLFFNISRHKQNLKRIAFHANQRNHQQLDQHQHLQQQQQQQQQQYRQPQIYERKNDTDQSNQRLSSASNQSFRIDPIATSPSASLSYTASCDEDENGFLTDFSISSSTQSLILNTGYDSFISKRMTLNDSSSKFNSLELGSGTIGSASTGTPKKIPSISSENGKSLLNNRNVSSRISQPGAIISNCGGIGNGCINTYPNQSINNATKNLINSSIPVPGTATNLQQQLRKSSNNKEVLKLRSVCGTLCTPF
ncbi:hypothetical protein NH340_JMT01275 [Sarcoptes scabiei]|nr:hypothetical protein NH340_JMT01275 [Sarcoptes scabiei]